MAALLLGYLVAVLYFVNFGTGILWVEYHHVEFTDGELQLENLLCRVCNFGFQEYDFFHHASVYFIENPFFDCHAFVNRNLFERLV